MEVWGGGMKYPLLFTFRDVVLGNGFIAGVEIAGKALLVDEGDEAGYWIYGVRPGAIASGPNDGPKDAMNDFRRVFRGTLQEMAAFASSFDEFKDDVEQFFNQEDSDADVWQRAVEEIRANPESVELAWEARGNADDERGFSVTDLTNQIRADANPDPFDHEMPLAA